MRGCLWQCSTNSALLLSARSGINDGACPGVGYQTGTLTQEHFAVDNFVFDVHKSKYTSRSFVSLF